MLQRGLLFTALDHHIKEIDVPAPPYDCNAILPSAYATFLPGADPEHLLLADVPFSGAVGRPLVLVYDASSSGPVNAAARRLTSGLSKEHLGVQVHGDALALCTHPGTAFTTADWERLDNAIYEQLADPSADVQAVAADCRAGQYDFSGQHMGEEDEDANKDDAGGDLQDELGEA